MSKLANINFNFVNVIAHSPPTPLLWLQPATQQEDNLMQAKKLNEQVYIDRIYKNTNEQINLQLTLFDRTDQTLFPTYLSCVKVFEYSYIPTIVSRLFSKTNLNVLSFLSK